MAGGIKLAPLLTEIKVDIAGFKSNMSKAAAAGVMEAEKISKKMSAVTQAGESLSRTGAMLTKGLTIPIAGVAIATGKMAVDFESSFAKVSTLLDSNVVDFGKYKNQLIDSSSKSKVAVGDFSEAVYQSISAGVDQTKAIAFTTEAMKLAKGGFTDGAKAVDVLTTAINGYGLKSEDATKISDMLITTQNLGKTTVDELASSMGAVIPVANSVNFGVEELSASYAQLTKNGIATSESGTYLKQMLSELGKSGSVADKALRELTGKGFADLKKEGVPTADILKQLGDYAEGNGKTLKDMFGSVEAGTAALVLAKGDGAEYNEMLEAMKNSAGATQEAFDKMDATPLEQLKGALNELKNAGIKFGGAFVPVLIKVSLALTKTANAFSNLTAEQKDNVIKWGAVLLAVGPVMRVVGGTITTFTKLSSILGGVSKVLGVAGGASGVTGGFIGLLGTCAPLAVGVAAVGTGIYALHERGQLMNRTVLESKEELSGMEKALAYLTGTEVKSKKEMEELGWKHKEFSKDISPEFQKAVENSTKKVQDFDIFLQELGMDDVITPEESKEFNNRVNTMCDETITAVNGKKEKSQAALKGLFIADDNVLDESEKKVLEILSKSSDAQVAEVETLRGEIVAIKQKAVDEARELNAQEIKDIEAKIERIRQIELEALGGTQEEIMYAKNEFAARVKTMNLKSASDLLNEKAKSRDEEIVKIKASYDTEIEMLKGSLGGKTAEEQKAINEQITNLEKDRSDKIRIQKELYDSYLDIINQNNPKLMEGINKFNGKVLAEGDIHSQKMLADAQKRYKGINQITKSGCYEMYNTVDGEYTRVAVKIDQKTGEVIGIHDKTSGFTAGYCQSMANSAQKMANSQDASFQRIITAEGMYVNYTSGEVCLANGLAVGSLNDLTAATDGTRSGIININGTPYEITVNSDGTIGALNEIGYAADNAAQDRYMTIHVSSEFSGNPSVMAYDGVKGDKYGWHYNGLDNVPYDGYQAVLHKNERVLTAEENKSYSSGADIDYARMEQSMKSAMKDLALTIGNREFGRIVDARLRERGILA